MRQIDERKRLSMRVAERILDSIRDGTYAPGDRLPPERALAEEFRVSRNSVREALSALELSEIIEARVGSGTYVRRLPGSDIDFEGSLSAVDMGFDAIEVWEAHRELDIAVAGLAAERATSADCHALGAIQQDLEAAAHDDDVDEVLVQSWRFRRAMAQAAENRPLETAQSILRKITERAFVKTLTADALRGRLLDAAAAHSNILLGVRLRDREATAEAVRAYYEILQAHLDTVVFRRPTKDRPAEAA